MQKLGWFTIWFTLWFRYLVSIRHFLVSIHFVTQPKPTQPKSHSTQASNSSADVTCLPGHRQIRNQDKDENFRQLRVAAPG